MRETVIRNAIRCVHCGAEVESTAGYDFRRHTCAAMQAARGADAYIAADGGLEYLRRVGHPADWVEASTTEPPIDASDEEALRQRRIRLLAGETAESQAPAVEAESETAELLLRALEQGNRDVSEGRTKLAEAALNQLRARLNEPDAHERLDRVIAARGRAKVPPLAGRDFPSDLHLVLVAAETLAGDLERARAWLDVPLPEYDHLTPRQLVDCGRADTVLAHIAQLQSGSSG